NTVLNNCGIRRRFQSAVSAKTRCGENDVVCLPLFWWTTRVDQRRVLSIERAGCAVGVGQIIKAIEHLHFKAAHQKDSAVSAILALIGSHQRWFVEFDVQLNISKFLTREDIPLA